MLVAAGNRNWIEKEKDIKLFLYRISQWWWFARASSHLDCGIFFSLYYASISKRELALYLRKKCVHKLVRMTQKRNTRICKDGFWPQKYLLFPLSLFPFQHSRHFRYCTGKRFDRRWASRSYAKDAYDRGELRRYASHAHTNLMESFNIHTHAKKIKCRTIFDKLTRI